MTMRVVAKFYPLNEAETVKAKDALEQFKSDVLAPKGAYIAGLPVIETTEEETVKFEANYQPQTQVVTQKVVKIDGWVHLDK